MDLFNLTQEETTRLKRITARKKQSSVWAYGEDRDGLPIFVGRRCFYFQEYCIFESALKLAPKFDKVPKDLLGFRFPASKNKPNGILEMTEQGVSFYRQDRRDYDERLNQFKRQAIALKEKYKSHTSKTFMQKKQALQEEHDEYVKQWQFRKRQTPANWNRLAHYPTIEECHKFLTTIGYEPKF